MNRISCPEGEKIAMIYEEKRIVEGYKKDIVNENYDKQGICFYTYFTLAEQQQIG